MHVDEVLTRIVVAGAPTVANDVRLYLPRMFHLAIKRKRIDSNPPYGFEVADAGGTEQAKSRWQRAQELQTLAERMRTTPNFGRQNELAVRLPSSRCSRSAATACSQRGYSCANGSVGGTPTAPPSFEPGHPERRAQAGAAEGLRALRRAPRPSSFLGALD